MMKPNILLLEYISEKALTILQEHTNVQVANTPKSAMNIAAKMPIKAIVTRGSGIVNKSLIKRCKELKVIARCGVGLDNVDIYAASEQGIMVINTPGSNADTVAEHTLALMLSGYRQIPAYAHHAKNNDWMHRNQYGGDEIRGKTLGILGMGNIGQKVAQLATAFGMSVQFWNRTPKKTLYQQVDFDRVLSTSDIISLHLPQVPATHHLIDAAAFQKMKPTTLLINTARGSVIEETALLDALKNESIAGFAADVVQNEPPMDDLPLFQLPNVLITPHTASLTATTFKEMCVVTVRNLLAILDGGSFDEGVVFNRQFF